MFTIFATLLIVINFTDMLIKFLIRKFARKISSHIVSEKYQSDSITNIKYIRYVASRIRL